MNESMILFIENAKLYNFYFVNRFWNKFISCIFSLIYIRIFFSILLFILVASCASKNSNYTSTKSEVKIGEQFLARGEYEKGYKLLDAIAISNSHSSVTNLALADAYYRQDAYLKAFSQYQKAYELGAALQGSLGMARVNLARNKPEAVKTQLSPLLKEMPGNIEILNIMAVAFDLSGQHQQAQEYYQKILAYNPANKKAYNNYALSLALTGHSKRAYSRILELSRSYQHDDKIRQNMALIQYLAGYHKQAFKTALIDLDKPKAQHNFRILRTYKP